MSKVRVRPILVESKDITDIWWSGHKLYYGRTPQEPRTPCYELSLISLENEKVNVGDKYYDEHNQMILTASSQSDHNIYHYKKVIAHQSQISPDFIKHLVDEYNNRGMEDFEIEIEEILEDEGIKVAFGESDYKPN